MKYLLRTAALGGIGLGALFIRKKYQKDFSIQGRENPIHAVLPNFDPLIPLKGSANFRDLGAYPTQSGRSIKKSKLFRSDRLSGLKNADLLQLEKIGIKSVCDFRGLDEVAHKPNRLPRNAQTYWLPIYNPNRPVGDFVSKMRTWRDPEEAKEFLVKANLNLVKNYAPLFQQFFEIILEEENLPLVFHCTAGKDRTGFAAALLLGALGVSREIIEADYLASNHYRRQENIKLIRRAQLFGVVSEVLVPIMEVRPHYLGAALDWMEEEYGGLDTYLSQAIALDASKRARLAELFLD